MCGHISEYMHHICQCCISHTVIVRAGNVPCEASCTPPPPHRIHMRGEVELLTGRLERVNLAKSMAESKLSDFDRYKAVIELEMNELIARHKIAITEKMARAAQVLNVMV